MRTDDLIDALSRNTEPVRPHRGGRALAVALVVAVPLALLLMLRQMGLNPALDAYLAQPMFWVKLLFGVALATTGLWLSLRLARPGVAAGRAAIAPLLPIALLWVLAAIALATASADELPALVFGSSWAVCPTNIATLSLPAFIAMMLALRTMAPTRLAAAGAAAGLAAGGIGTAVYALHCPELAAPFLALWYVTGAAIPVIVGALLGSRLLRW